MRLFKINWHGFARTRGGFTWGVGPLLRWDPWATYSWVPGGIDYVFPIVPVARQSSTYYTYKKDEWFR